MKEQFGGRHINKGFSIIEAIVSIAIATIFFAGIFDTSRTIQGTALNTNLSLQAEILAKNAINKTSSFLITNFNATTSSEIQLPRPFSGVLQVNNITACRKEIVGKINWNTDLSSRNHEVIFSSLVGSVQTLKYLGNDCGGNDFIASISSTTQLALGSLDAQLGIKLTGIDIYNHTAFISAISSDESSPDLIVANTDENFSTIATFNFGVGVNTLDVANGYGFLAQNSTSSQLAVIDVKNPVTPILIASTTLPGVAGDRPQGWSIYYYDSKIYIGTKRTAGREFHIYDVSNPSLPIWLGSKELNHNINSIVVRQGIAYLATSGNTKDLIVLDARNPSNIIEKTSLDLPGNEDGKSLYLIGNTLYLGRFKSLNNTSHHDFYALDISNVSLNGAVSVLGFYDIHADVNSIRVIGPYAFLGTSDSNHELSVLDISSSTSMTISKNIDLVSKATGIDYENGAVMISSFDPAKIYKVNLTEQP